MRFCTAAAPAVAAEGGALAKEGMVSEEKPNVVIAGDAPTGPE